MCVYVWVGVGMRARAWGEFGKHVLDHPLILVGSMFHIFEDSSSSCYAQQVLLENLFALMVRNAPLYIPYYVHCSSS